MKFAHRGFIGLACLLAAFAGIAMAADSDALRALRGGGPGATPGAPAQAGVGGEWSGRYQCRQGITGARVVFSADASQGLFHFYAVPENPGVPEGCFRISGNFDPTTRTLNVRAGSWIVRPRNYVAANFTGLVDAEQKSFLGRITGLAGCTVIVLTREPSPRSLPEACARGLP